MRTQTRPFAALAVMSIAAVLALGFWNASRSDQPGAPSWPAFELTYREPGATGSLRTIEFASIDNWSVTDASGRREQAVEDGYAIDYIEGVEHGREPVPSRTVPNYWLVPGRLAQHSSRPGATIAHSDNRIIVSFDVPSTCAGTNCQTLQPAVETWHFDASSKIPVLIESRLANGSTTRLLEVTELFLPGSPN